VTKAEAESILRQAEFARVLEGYRGGLKIDLGLLGRAVSDFSRILPENPTIDQVEANPLIVTSNKIFAVDARAGR
jgi:acetyltransferase